MACTEQMTMVACEEATIDEEDFEDGQENLSSGDESYCLQNFYSDQIDHYQKITKTF